jgi:hypothetical protein
LLVGLEVGSGDFDGNVDGTLTGSIVRNAKVVLIMAEYSGEDSGAERRECQYSYTTRTVLHRTPTAAYSILSVNF